MDTEQALQATMTADQELLDQPAELRREVRMVESLGNGSGEGFTC
jgi:hypothetical protein